MKRKLFSTVFVVMFTMVGEIICAQDVHFSQFYELITHINPSTTGAYNGDVRASIGHKQQWTGVGGGYTTSFGSVDMPLGKHEKGNNRMALGAGFYMDKAGTANFGTTQFFLNYAYPIKLNENNMLSAGIMLGFTQIGLDRSKLKWDDQYVDGSYDPSNQTNEQYNEVVNSNFFDSGIGFLWRQNSAKFNWNAGVSTYHLQEPENSLGGGSHIVSRKYIAHGEAEIARRSYSLLPKFMLAMQGSHMEITGGSLIKYQIGSQSLYTNARTSSAAFGGIFYRYNDAVIAVVQYSFNQMLMAGISYDINISKFQRASNLKGGFEITLKYQGIFETKRKKL